MNTAKDIPAALGPRLLPHLLEIEDDDPRDAPWHMAADEFLLQTMAEPALRFYRWRRPQATFGYFLRRSDVSSACPGWNLTRRWTGGGLVRHGADVTFSLVLPGKSPLGRQHGRMLYEKIHRCVAQALSSNESDLSLNLDLGLDLELAPETAHSPARADDCFLAPVPADVLRQGRKVAGGALRRTRAGILYQGSICEPGVTDQLLPKQRLEDGLRRRFSHETKRRSWTPTEREEIENLAQQRYASLEWKDRC